MLVFREKKCTRTKWMIPYGISTLFSSIMVLVTYILIAVL